MRILSPPGLTDLPEDLLLLKSGNVSSKKVFLVLDNVRWRISLWFWKRDVFWKLFWRLWFAESCLYNFEKLTKCVFSGSKILSKFWMLKSIEKNLWKETFRILFRDCFRVLLGTSVSCLPLLLQLFFCPKFFKLIWFRLSERTILIDQFSLQHSCFWKDNFDEDYSVYF